MLPFLTLVAIAAAMMGMLNSLHHYFVPALAPAMFNVATIVCAFVLVAAHAGARTAAHHGDRDRGARSAGSGRSPCSGRRCAREGFRYRAVARPARSGAAARCCC